MGKKSKFTPETWQNGGSPNRKFAPIYLTMVSHERWIGLSCYAKSLYVLLALQYDGKKNRVILTVDQASKGLGISKPTVMRAFYQLEEHGFIEILDEHRVRGGEHKPNVYKFSTKWVTGEKTNTGKRCLPILVNEVDQLSGDPEKNEDIGKRG